jgi:broad specificity phosphatase PhoE
MKIYLIRHGESTGDLEDRYGGAYDDHLTQKGRDDAHRLADAISDKGIEIIYCSPKLRAQEAVEIVNEKLHVPVETVEEFSERDYGILGGMVKIEAKEKYPEAVLNHADMYNTDPEGESYESFKTRVLDSFEKIISNDTHQTVVIFSHGGPIKLLYRELFKNGELEDLGDYGILELEKDNELKYIGLNRLQ